MERRSCRAWCWVSRAPATPCEPSKRWRRGKLHPLQETFADLGAAQCGYCTPAFLLAAEALLADNPKPTRAEIKDALAGNLCRCTGYIKIYEAVELAAARMRGEKAEPKTESLYGR